MLRSKILLPVLMLTTTSAYSHIEIGTYEGKTADGVECEMEVKQVYYLNDMHHPLNERVEVESEGRSYTLQHPPVIKADQGIAYFNHDVFQGILAEPTGASAMEIKMVHSESQDGPVSFSVINHNYKNSIHKVTECLGIQYQGN